MRRQLPVLGLCAAFLAGCGGLAEVRQAENQASRVAGEIAQFQPQGPRYSKLRTSSRPWLGLTEVAAAPGDGLPPELDATDGVTLPLQGTLGDPLLASRIEAATGLAVRLEGAAPDAGAGISADFAASLADGWSPSGGIWTGPLPALLDAWTSASGYRWRYDAAAEAIRIVRRETALFQVNALLGAQSYATRSTTAESGSGEGASSQSSQSLSTQANFNPWREIEEQVKALVDQETSLTVSPSAALITVSGRPGEIDRVRNFLRHLNTAVLRPLTISAHIYAVRVASEADYEVGIVGTLERIMRGRGAGLQLAVGAAGADIAIVKPLASARADTDTLAATVSALNSVGTISRVLSADVPSLNGKPAQFFELLKTAYLKEISIEQTDSGSRTQLKPGTVASGFSMSYLARIVAPDEVLVRLFASLRDRPSFAVFGSSSTGQIQLPTYADRAVTVTQRLRRGETMVITGFRDLSASADRAGTFDAGVPLPEGARRGSSIRIEQILLVRAEVGPPLGIVESRGRAGS